MVLVFLSFFLWLFFLEFREVFFGGTELRFSFLMPVAGGGAVTSVVVSCTAPDFGGISKPFAAYREGSEKIDLEGPMKRRVPSVSEGVRGVCFDEVGREMVVHVVLDREDG